MHANHICNSSRSVIFTHLQQHKQLSLVHMQPQHAEHDQLTSPDSAMTKTGRSHCCRVSRSLLQLPRRASPSSAHPGPARPALREGCKHLGRRQRSRSDRTLPEKKLFYTPIATIAWFALPVLRGCFPVLTAVSVTGRRIQSFLSNSNAPDKHPRPGRAQGCKDAQKRGGLCFLLQRLVGTDFFCGDDNCCQTLCCITKNCLF